MSHRLAQPASALPALLTGLALTAGGCHAPKPELTAPQITVAPYENAQGEVLWAVVPLRNESATTAVDALAVSDAIVAATQEVRGLRCLAMNRTIETMRALRMGTVATPADAQKLAAALGVDGLVVGTITDYDPYTPTLGLSLAVFARTAAMQPAGRTISEQNLDSRNLTFRTTEPTPAPGSNFRGGPASSVSEHLDGKNHQVLMDVRAYAAGRHSPADALGWKRYVASMPLYTEFCAQFAVSRLVQREWIRLESARSVAGAALTEWSKE